MKVINYISVGLIGCALFAFAAEQNTSSQKTYTKDQIKDLLADLEAGSALSSVIVLEALRKGDSQQAIESLEFSIDASVTSIGARLKGQPVVPGSSIHIALAKIKSYRTRYPRSETTDNLGRRFDETQKPVVEKANVFLKSIKD